MRVTQSMLAQNSLNNLNQSFERMGVLQEQLSTGKKITKASQDPVVAMSGIRYRGETNQIQQFQRNVGEVNNWMDSTDSALGKATDAMQRVRELTTQAANGSYEEGQRGNIAEEVTQLTQHVADMANSEVNGKHIFNGTDTTTPPVLNPENPGEENLEDYQITNNGDVYEHTNTNAAENEYTFHVGGDPANSSITLNYDNENNLENITDGGGNSIDKEEIIVTKESTNNNDVEIEVMQGVKMPVNSNPENTFQNGLFQDLTSLSATLRDENAGSEEISNHLDTMDKHIDNIVNERAEVGARQNRVEMIENRLGNQEVTAEEIMSENEDADMEKVIMNLMSQENVHQAALSSGARIIQPTLMDFLR
ncbi:flagellar hook-associated protein FlgL [Salibacterium qingdaonense]|uniref:Flagellar hook-associated protein 3 FlgL n=1 Tax=Salibacterium qingdaonense TaxID=266892 RepID=A0A1I4L089_9BACI|nr:flagellar hook-associated protein FlgL [Salibacterium qingdaonense]SFL84428.1 flagellar hook-associated protein 3 FlgL [Salibacterium qingdaonense]